MRRGDGESRGAISECGSFLREERGQFALKNARGGIAAGVGKKTFEKILLAIFVFVCYTFFVDERRSTEWT